MSRKILHLRVGNEDWNPTEEELLAVLNLFEEAVAKSGPDGILTVSTPYQVSAEILDLDQCTKIVVETYSREIKND